MTGDRCHFHRGAEWLWQRVAGCAGLTRHDAIGAVDRYGETASKRSWQRSHRRASAVELLWSDMSRHLESLDGGVEDLRGIVFDEVGQRGEHTHRPVHSTCAADLRQILDCCSEIVVLEVAKQCRYETSRETIGSQKGEPHDLRAIWRIAVQLRKQLVELAHGEPGGPDRELLGIWVNASYKGEARHRRRRGVKGHAFKARELRLDLASGVSKRRHDSVDVTTRWRLERESLPVMKL